MGLRCDRGILIGTIPLKKSASTLENFSTKASKTVTHCKICSINGHVMGQCAKYSSFESRHS